MEFLGKDGKGYSYQLSSDGHVYQFAPDGRRIGWFCSEAAWIGTMHKMVFCRRCLENETDPGLLCHRCAEETAEERDRIEHADRCDWREEARP